MDSLRLGLATLVVVMMACGEHPKGPNCKADQDCKPPLVCGENKCVECNEDKQCPTAKPRCTAHACVAKAECEKDDQCPAGKVCQAGQCKPCASDGECGPGGACDAGACSRPKKCSKDAD